MKRPVRLEEVDLSAMHLLYIPPDWPIEG